MAKEEKKEDIPKCSILKIDTVGTHVLSSSSFLMGRRIPEIETSSGWFNAD